MAGHKKKPTGKSNLISKSQSQRTIEALPFKKNDIDEKYPISLIISGIYFFIFSYIAIQYFEPWRDLAHIWMSVKDSSFLELLFKTPIGAHPFLWSLIIKPFTAFGAPYISSVIVNIFFCAASIYLVLKYAPIPTYFKILFIVSYPFIYEFALPGRIYSLGTFLTFLACYQYDKRKEKPILFAILLSGLMHTHALFIGFWAPVGGLFFIETFLDKKIVFKTKVIVASILSLFGIYLLWYIYQNQKFSSLLNVGAKPNFIANLFGLSFNAENSIFWVFGLLTVLLLLLNLIGRKIGYLYIIMLLITVYIYHNVTPNFLRYYFILPILVTSFYWLINKEFENTGFYPSKRTEYINLIIGVIFSLCCLISFKNGIQMLSREIKENHSDSREAGYFINRNYPDYIIAGHRCYTASAVIPYLKTQKEIWMADEKIFVSFLTFDSLYYQSAFKYNYPQAVQNVMNQFPNEKNILLLFSIALPPEFNKDWKLVYQSKSKPIQSDEVYFIYEKVK